MRPTRIRVRVAALCAGALLVAAPARADDDATLVKEILAKVCGKAEAEIATKLEEVRKKCTGDMVNANGGTVHEPCMTKENAVVDTEPCFTCTVKDLGKRTISYLTDTSAAVEVEVRGFTAKVSFRVRGQCEMAEQIADKQEKAGNGESHVELSNRYASVTTSMLASGSISISIGPRILAVTGDARIKCDTKLAAEGFIYWTRVDAVCGTACKKPKLAATPMAITAETEEDVALCVDDAETHEPLPLPELEADVVLAE
jgi:hypothetical protein